MAKEQGRATATDIALATGLANNTLTSMIKKLVEQGLVKIEQSDQDKRKKFVVLTELGWAQKKLEIALVRNWERYSTKAFRITKSKNLRRYQERIINNLKKKENVE